MKKLLWRVALATGTVGAIVAGSAAFSAFEAHVVNVTATINNATGVDVSAITFGNVFPEQVQVNPINFSLSASFLSASNTNASILTYVLKQKPKCMGNASGTIGTFAQVLDVPGNGTSTPITFTCPAGFVEMPLLCPYLSKHGSNTGDTNIPSFHGPTDLAS